MYHQLRVKNFRGLRDLIIDDLGRLNLFVGPNNVGKTSLLEALWLFQAPSNPTMTVNVAGFRGFNVQQQTPDPLWHPLFYNMDLTTSIEIKGTNSDGTGEILKITVSRNWVGDLTAGGDNRANGTGAVGGAVSAAATPETLVYEYVANGGPPASARFSLALGRMGLQVDPAFTGRPELRNRQSIFLASRHRTTPEELADRFTTADDSVGTEPLVAVLQELQPGLKGLSIGYTLASQQPSLRAQIAGVPGSMPLHLLGEGSGRLTEILLAIPTVRGGLLLVDEIENGLYYRNLEVTWRAIDDASRRSAVQIFATTHSAECVQAAVQAVADISAEDFRLHRLERIDDNIRVVTYDHATAKSALDFDLEFR